MLGAWRELHDTCPTFPFFFIGFYVEKILIQEIVIFRLLSILPEGSNKDSGSYLYN